MLNVQINTPRTLDPVIRSVARFAGGSLPAAQNIFIDPVGGVHTSPYHWRLYDAKL